MAEGDDAGAKEKYNQAIDAFITATKRLPTRLEYYTELVKLLNRVGRFNEAEKYSDRAIIVYHWVTMAQNVEYLFYLWKGQALIAQNKLDEAIEVLSKAPELVYDKHNPDQKAKGARPVPLEDQPQAYLLLGQAYEKKGDLAKAEEQYNKYLTRNNRLPKDNRSNDILFFQGRLYEKIADGEPDAETRLKYKAWAKEKYDMVVRLNEDFAKFKEKKGGVLTDKDAKQFYSENGRPLSDKMYQEALKGLQRIETGQPYPKEEEVVPIESESVQIGEAQIATDEEEGNK
jgi:tetratricopeptide (TPR) repeat protein